MEVVQVRKDWTSVMMIDEKSTTWLIWKDIKSRQRFKIGEIYKRDNKYFFRYILDGVRDAMKHNFQPLICFPILSAEYQSEDLFAVFLSRLPDRRRRDIKSILNKYGLEQYDAYNLLKKSGGKLPIDTLEFVEPIILDSGDKTIVRDFFIAGTRYYELCDQKTCEFKITLYQGQLLKLIRDSGNAYDKFAVIIATLDDKKIGYVPSFYSEAVSEAIEKQYQIDCKVLNFYSNNNCEECVKAEIKIYVR